MWHITSTMLKNAATADAEECITDEFITATIAQIKTIATNRNELNKTIYFPKTSII